MDFESESFEKVLDKIQYEELKIKKLITVKDEDEVIEVWVPSQMIKKIILLED